MNEWNANLHFGTPDGHTQTQIWCTINTNIWCTINNIISTLLRISIAALICHPTRQSNII